MSTISPNTGIPVTKADNASAIGDFFTPNFLIIAFAIETIPPDSKRNIPNITPSPVTIPIPPTVLENPEVIVLLISSTGIRTSKAVRIEVSSNETNAFILNFMIVTNKNTMDITNTTINKGPVNIFQSSRSFLFLRYPLYLSLSYATIIGYLIQFP